MCVFCKIIDGSIPSYKVFEDSEVLAFLDLSQLTIGHTLVIPKKHVENIFELDSNTASNLFERVVLVANLLKKNLNINDLNLINNNGKLASQTVNHYHIHLLPRYENDEFKFSSLPNKLSEEDFLILKEQISKK